MCFSLNTDSKTSSFQAEDRVREVGYAISFKTGCRIILLI